MSGWRFLLSKQWAGYLALTIVFAVVCSGLGMWQLARRAEAQAEISRVDANFDADAVNLTDALPTLDSFEESQKWLPVEMTGTYLLDEELLVRNRTFNINPGFEVLTPLLLANGDIFIVDRGWIPTGENQDAPDSVPAAPTGEVTVVARLKQGEPVLAGRSATGNQVATINLPAIADRLGADTYTGAYGLMKTEDPAPADRPTAVARPVRDEGPHLSYAFQWLVFAIIAFVGLGVAIRNEYRIINADDPEEQDRERARQAKRARKQPSDADVEDRILDEAR